MTAVCDDNLIWLFFIKVIKKKFHSPDANFKNKIQDIIQVDDILYSDDIKEK